MKKYGWSLSGIILLVILTSCVPSAPRSEIGQKQLIQPTPIPTKEVMPEIQAHIKHGGQLFEKLKSQIPGDKNPEVRGQLSKNPTLTLYVTNKIWKGLSKEQQVDLTWFVENEIKTVQTRPEKYVDIPQTAPLYPRFVEITRNLCDDCWAIILGNPVRQDGKLTMTVDKTIIQGDSAWENDDSFNHCCRGIKGSRFRK